MVQASGYPIVVASSLRASHYAHLGGVCRWRFSLEVWSQSIHEVPQFRLRCQPAAAQAVAAKPFDSPRGRFTSMLDPPDDRPQVCRPPVPTGRDELGGFGHRQKSFGFLHDFSTFLFSLLAWMFNEDCKRANARETK
jgi:hypothetical protein